MNRASTVSLPIISSPLGRRIITLVSLGFALAAIRTMSLLAVVGHLIVTPLYVFFGAFTLFFVKTSINLSQKFYNKLYTAIDDRQRTLEEKKIDPNSKRIMDKTAIAIIEFTASRFILPILNHVNYTTKAVFVSFIPIFFMVYNQILIWKIISTITIISFGLAYLKVQHAHNYDQFTSIFYRTNLIIMKFSAALFLVEGIFYLKDINSFNFLFIPNNLLKIAAEYVATTFTFINSFTTGPCIHAAFFSMRIFRETVTFCVAYVLDALVADMYKFPLKGVFYAYGLFLEIAYPIYSIANFYKAIYLFLFKEHYPYAPSPVESPTNTTPGTQEEEHTFHIESPVKTNDSQGTLITRLVEEHFGIYLPGIIINHETAPQAEDVTPPLTAESPTPAMRD